MPINRGVPTLPGVYRYPNVQSTNRVHQAEKPVILMEDLIKIVPNGSTVLDCFMGSGTTGVAAINTGRKFIGIESAPENYKVAKQRISKAYTQTSNGFV